jgi:hypothetical protein
MNSSRLGAGLTATVLILGLVACSNDTADAPPMAGTPSPAPSMPSATSTPTETPSPRPSVQPTHTSQKLGALTLVQNHTAPPANAELALEAYEEYERATHNSQATNVEDPRLTKVAAAQPVQLVRDSVRDQKAKGVKTGGTITITAKLVRASGSLAVFTGCYNQSKSLLVRANGTSYTGPLTKQYPQLNLNVVVTNVSGVWTVTEYLLKAGSC